MDIKSKIVAYAFVAFWFWWSVFLPLAKPKKVVQWFPTYFRLWGITKDRMPNWYLVFCKIIGGICLVVGLFIWLF